MLSSIACEDMNTSQESRSTLPLLEISFENLTSDMFPRLLVASPTSILRHLERKKQKGKLNGVNSFRLAGRMLSSLSVLSG